jgi:hypothetical protein
LKIYSDSKPRINSSLFQANIGRVGPVAATNDLSPDWSRRTIPGVVVYWCNETCPPKKNAAANFRKAPVDAVRVFPTLIIMNAVYLGTFLMWGIVNETVPKIT